MPSSASAQRHTTTRPGFSPCPWRGTWAQLTLQTTVLVLLLTTRYGAARPAFLDYIPADEVSRGSAAAIRSEGLDLQSLCDRTQSIELRVLCRLTQRGDSWLDGEGRKKPVSKRSGKLTVLIPYTMNTKRHTAKKIIFLKPISELLEL